MINLLQASFWFIIPLLIVALGGMITERSGVTNIALDGIMVIGAFVGILVLTSLEKQANFDTQLIFVVAMFASGIAGALFSLIHAFASIKMKADQTVSATALNLLSPAIYTFAATTMLTGGSIIYFNRDYRMDSIPFLSDIPLLGDIFFKNAFISTFIGFLLVYFVYVFMYKTKTGMRIRSIGENPQAADSLGINVYKLRYLAVSLSGFFAGIGGLVFTVTTSNSFTGNMNGYGFLAIAVVIFGNWKPLSILGAAVLFGFLSAFGAVAPTIFPMINLPTQIYQMIPYIVTLIVLAITSKNSSAPKAIGKAYDQGER